jgi:hypothetical protein
MALLPDRRLSAGLRKITFSVAETGLPVWSGVKPGRTVVFTAMEEVVWTSGSGNTMRSR